MLPVYLQASALTTGLLGTGDLIVADGTTPPPPPLPLPLPLDDVTPLTSYRSKQLVGITL